MFKSSSLLIGFVFLAGGYPALAQALDWDIVLDRTTHKCSVLHKPLPPGVYSFGSFSTRKDACKSAPDYFDENQSNSDKCFDYVPQTRSDCSVDDVLLPVTRK
jgi:hypothetical protein